MSGRVIAALIGLAAGLLSGMFGIGGGLVTTPAIRLILGYPALLSVGTPLPVIVPTALAGAFQHARDGRVDVRAGVLVGCAGIATSVAGAYVAEFVGGAILMVITAAVIIYAALDMIVATRRDTDSAAIGVARDTGSAATPSTPLAPRRAVAIGLTAGFYSGLLGLGGGAIVVPMLVRWARFPIKRAVGTSLVAVALFAVPGSITHALLGHVDLGLALALAVGVVPGALLGARITRVVRDAHVRVGFAAVLLLAGLALALNELIA